MSGLPKVLATQRNYILTDGLFYNVDKDGNRSPVEVKNHTIIGVDNAKKDAEKFAILANPQRVDSAKLSPDAVAYQVRFSLAFIPMEKSLSKIAGESSQQLKAQLAKFIASALNSDGLTEVANRIARNVLNGRWLWRNRITAQSIQVRVIKGEQELASSDALSISLNSFDEFSDNEKKLGEQIKDQLKGMANDELKITAELTPRVTGAAEVYPSQNYLDKPKGDNALPSKSLYVVNPRSPAKQNGAVTIVGQAALRDQKISNALRTIDTWYSDEQGLRPIAVEFYGANIDDQAFYRKGKGKGAAKNAIQLMETVEDLDPNSEDGMFFIGCLLRGGVYV